MSCSDANMPRLTTQQVHRTDRSCLRSEICSLLLAASIDLLTSAEQPSPLISQGQRALIQTNPPSVGQPRDRKQRERTRRNPGALNTDWSEPFRAECLSMHIHLDLPGGTASHTLVACQIVLLPSSANGWGHQLYRSTGRQSSFGQICLPERGFGVSCAPVVLRLLSSVTRPRIVGKPLPTPRNWRFLARHAPQLQRCGTIRGSAGQGREPMSRHAQWYSPLWLHLNNPQRSDKCSR